LLLQQREADGGGMLDPITAWQTDTLSHDSLLAGVSTPELSIDELRPHVVDAMAHRRTTGRFTPGWAARLRRRNPGVTAQSLPAEPLPPMFGPAG
jgi:hypothetical protein